MKKPLVYLGGDIMSRGSNLAREEEYNKFLQEKIPVDVYSPVMNKSINDKSNMTVEENNHLAEKITAADIERLWNSDAVVMCPEQNAIGSLCETGCLFGWQYMAKKLLNIYQSAVKLHQDPITILQTLINELLRIGNQQQYFHYFDIRTNHLPEVDWRRSFSINQLLYGMILAMSDSEDTAIQSFDDIITQLKTIYGTESEEQTIE